MSTDWLTTRVRALLLIALEPLVLLPAAVVGTAVPEAAPEVAPMLELVAPEPETEKAWKGTRTWLPLAPVALLPVPVPVEVPLPVLSEAPVVGATVAVALPEVEELLEDEPAPLLTFTKT